MASDAKAPNILSINNKSIQRLSHFQANKRNKTVQLTWDPKGPEYSYKSLPANWYQYQLVDAIQRFRSRWAHRGFTQELLYCKYHLQGEEYKSNQLDQDFESLEPARHGGASLTEMKGCQNLKKERHGMEIDKFAFF